MGLDLGKLSARIEVRADGVDGTLAKVEQGLDRVGKKTDEVSSKTVKPKADTGGLDKATSAAEKTKKSLGDVDSEVIKPRVDTSELVAAEKHAGSLKATFGSLKGVAGMAAGAAGVASVGAAFGSIIKNGNELTNNMNVLGAVSGATEQQLKAAGAAARQLGTDTSLPATSAGDAAAAMAELAKGGFTVEQSMEAAKGTLQLAAAAQIDAASAATIQTQAMQAFGLEVSRAADVSDILAGAANASSAEIGGIAQGLQQAGSVANGFGVSIEDTATALAMFANAGIQGSDAGTLLKTSLLAITDQGKPAQAAMKQLGLQLYENGKFVGLPKMFDQLAKSQANMSDEAFQAAANTLFGSDAIRQAMVAAKNGAPGFEALREAVTRQGQAAEVAAAKTRGLPGAISQFENTMEDVGQRVYDTFDKPVTEALKNAASGVDALADRWLDPALTTGLDVGRNLAEQFNIVRDAATDAGKAVGDVLSPAIHTAEGAFNKIATASNESGMTTPLLAAAVTMLTAKYSGLSGALNNGSSRLVDFSRDALTVRAAAEAQGQSISQLSAHMQVLGQQSPAIARMNAAYEKGSPGLKRMAEDHKALAMAVKTTGAQSGDIYRAMDAGAASLRHNFVAHTAAMGNAATGFAKGGLSLMSSGMGGLMGAMGGPWGLALTAGSLAIGMLAEEHLKAKQAEMDHKAAQDQLRGSLDATTGAVTNQTNELQRKTAQDNGWLDTARELGVSSETVIAAMNGNAGAIREVNSAVDLSGKKLVENSDYWKKYGKEVEAAGLTAADVAAWTSGVDSAGAKLREKSGSFSVENAKGLRELKEQMDGATDAATKLKDGVASSSSTINDLQAQKKADELNRMAQAARDTSTVMGSLKDHIVAVPNDKTIVVKAGPEVESARAKLEEIGLKVSQPFEGKVNIEFPNGMHINQLLDDLGVKVSSLPDGFIKIDNPDAPGIIESLNLLNLKTTTLESGEVVINSNDPEVRKRMIDLGILVEAGANGQVKISDNFDPTLAKIREVNANDGRTTQQTHTIVNRIQEWREYYTSGRAVSTSGTAVGQHYASGGLTQLPRNASGDLTHGGYRLPTTGPGTNKRDGILGVDKNGAPISWVDAGEWITNRKRSGMYNNTLKAINQGTPQQILAALANELPRNAEGGKSAKVKSDLAGMNGTPYVFGGWSPAGVDCSGAVSLGVNSYLGLDPFDSRMSTANEAAWLEAKGFQRGMGGEGDVRVAFLNGGPGGGHTAMQLPDGTYIESGGNTGGGLTIGGSAGPLEGRGFTDFYFLPGTGGEDTTFSETVSGGSSSRRGRGGRSSAKASYNPISISDGQDSVFTAAQRMGLGGSNLSQAAQGTPLGGLAQGLDNLTQAANALLFVTEETVAAYNTLGEARAAEVDAANRIRDAERDLAEARENVGDAGSDAAEKVADKERALQKAREKAAETDSDTVNKIADKEAALAKAREKGDPEKIAKAERDLADVRDDAPKKTRDAADAVAKAEREVEKARKDAAQSATDSVEDVANAEAELVAARENAALAARKTAAAEARYRAEMAQAPFKQAESVIGAFGGIFSAASDMYRTMADRERKKLEQAKEALSVWQQQIDAQKSLQDAMEASTGAIREQVKSRWQSDLAVSDAEWQLALHRKRSSRELTEAQMFGINVTQIEAEQKRRSAVLEAQIAFEKAQRDLTAFQREQSIADTAIEMEHAHRMAAIQSSRLVLVTAALARVQGALNIEEMKALEAKAIKAQGMATTANGLGGVVGGIGGIIGALAMAATNPIGALVSGLGAIGGIMSGIGQMRAGRAQVEAAKEQEEALKNIGKGDPKFIKGLDSNSMEALDLQEQQLQIQYKQDQLARQRDSAKQRDLLQQLVDNAEKNLEYAKRDEQRALDLKQLEERSDNRTLFMQMGGSGWGGGNPTSRFVDRVSGFGGLGAGGLGAFGSSWELANSTVDVNVRELERMRNAVNSVVNVKTSDAAMATAEATQGMWRTLTDLNKIVGSINSQMGAGGDKIGAVFNGPVTLPNAEGYVQSNLEKQLTNALARA